MATVKNVQKIKCHDCKKEIKTNSNQELIDGVKLIYDNEGKKIEAFKCQKCFKKNKSLNNYQSCEVYSRVVGYLRPVQQWNVAKQNEFDKRKEYTI